MTHIWVSTSQPRIAQDSNHHEEELPVYVVKSQTLNFYLPLNKTTVSVAFQPQLHLDRSMRISRVG